MSLASSAGPILIGLLVHSALYGIYLVFFTGALYVEYMRRLRGLKTNVFLFTVTVVLFLFITAAWVIQILRTADASINGNFENYYLAKTSQNAANVALHMGQIIVADSTMLYRLYIVWGRSRRVVLLPLILTIGLIGAGCGVIYSMIPVSRVTGKLGLYLSSPVGSFSMIASFLGATLILNLAISGLISYRVWTVTREVVGLTGGRKTYSIVYILLENAALYIYWLHRFLPRWIHS
ncbi:hypothetical protein BD779DRAFT_433649 [Infundibulicybe gibba]|nr:hypothetical protein BD779DRAFT_433649 [Infundibulicybe gibba]